MAPLSAIIWVLSAAIPKKGLGDMELKHEDTITARRELKQLFAAELFSKLSDEKQDIVIDQIIALLSHE